jgi:GntR family transcriptional repressor for pyruvate dehydrogenase complex
VLRPVQRRSVPDEVFDQLVGDIVGGDLAAGDPLPSERRLAEVLGVSRPAVREALQRLAQAGLIEVRQGDTTTVRDYRRSGGLDLLPRLLAADGGPRLAVVRSILEARLALAPDVARRCALRRDEATVTRCRAVLAGLQALPTDDPVAAQPLVDELWDHVVDGSDNLVYRLLFNALQQAYLPVRPVLAPALADELLDRVGQQLLVEAIDAGDGAKAAAAARRLVGRGTAGAMARLDALGPLDG